MKINLSALVATVVAVAVSGAFGWALLTYAWLVQRLLLTGVFLVIGCLIYLLYLIFESFSDTWRKE